MPSRILIVEDERTTAEDLQSTLRDLGYEVTGIAANTQDALSSAGLNKPDVALLDVSLRGDGDTAVALGEKLQIPVVYLTAHADRELQQRAKRAKPLGHLVKPFQDSELQASIEIALHRPEWTASGGLAFGSLRVVTESEAMKRAVENVRQAAASAAPVVLIEGAGGSGKELIARALHALSPRSQGPFVPVMCAAIPETSIESALFGHERGAFAGANAQKKGLLEIAQGGTLFFDEIRNLSPAIQAKLLRVVQEGRFRRLGSMEDISVDLRVIGASSGTDREERALPFHQVAAAKIALPTLHERRADILPLARHFVQHVSSTKARIEGIAEDAAQLLQDHEWPGNVRELRSVIERALQVEDSRQLRARSVHFVAMPVESHAGDGDRPLTDTERALVLRALEKTGGNQTRSAKLLGITRDMLRYRMKKMRLRSGAVADMDATP